MYKEAKEAAEKGPKTALKNRIMLHVAHKVVCRASNTAKLFFVYWAMASALP